MTDPNPRGELTGCVRCPTGRTFHESAVCDRCRRAEKKQEAKDQREDGDR